MDTVSSRRLWFNKEILSCGYVPCNLNDNILLTYSVKQDDDFTPFASFEFIL